MSEVALKISFLSLMNVSDKTYIKVLFRKKDGRVPMFCVSPTVHCEIFKIDAHDFAYESCKCNKKDVNAHKNN